MTRDVAGYTVPDLDDPYAVAATGGDLEVLAATGGQARVEGDKRTLAAAVAHTDDTVSAVSAIDAGLARRVGEMVAEVDLTDAQGARLIDTTASEVLLGTNYATNPAGGNDGGWVSAATASYEATWETATSRRRIATSRPRRVRNISGTSSLIGALGWVGSHSTGTPIPASLIGREITAGCYVRDDGTVPARAQVAVSFYVDGSWQSYQYSPYEDIDPLTWTPQTMRVTPPARATHIRLYPRLATRSGEAAPLGCLSWFDSAWFGPDVYFDGGMAPGGGRSTRWTGPAHQSRSEAFLPPPSLTRTAADDRYKRPAIAPAFHRQSFVLRRGGRIGTGGLGAVAFRWDHWPDYAYDGLIDAHLEYGIPWSWAHYSQQRNPALARDQDGHDTTWTTIQRSALEHGAEMWCHGRTHSDQTTYEGRYDEAVTAKAELQASLPACAIEGFVIPGVGGTNWGGFNLTGSPENWLRTDVGRLIAEHYAVCTGHMGGMFRPLIGEPSNGLAHYTIERAGASTVISNIRHARNRRLGVCMMLHPRTVMQGGIGLSGYRQVLEFVAAERDAGNLAVLTMGGLLMADTSTDWRDDLITYGRFEGWRWDSGWTSTDWSGLTGADLPGLTADDVVASTSTAGASLSQSVNLSTVGHFAGGMRELIVPVWATGSGPRQGVRVRVNGSVIDRTFYVDHTLSSPGRRVIRVPHMLDGRRDSHEVEIIKAESGGRLYVHGVQLAAI